jgi:hypothetical protein
MAILLNKVINLPVIFEIKWDPFFNGEYWIDKDNALKFKDRIEVIHNDNIYEIDQNLNALFPNNTTFLKLGGIVLSSKILKVSQGKQCLVKYKENSIVSEGLIDQNVYLKCIKISDSELELRIIKRWKNIVVQNEDLMFNLSTLRLELDNDPISSKKIILNFIGKNINEDTNSISIKNTLNPLEVSNIENQLILKSSIDDDGDEFVVEMQEIINSEYKNI